MSPLNSARLRPFQPAPFGRYTLLAPLSVGGMGEIFLARLDGGPNGFEKLCVIKKILPQLAADPDFVSRFMNEGKILVKLSHGSIAQVLEMGLHDGAPYIALEFVDGKDLRKIATRLRERGEKLPIPIALYVMTRVLDALGYAHRKRDEQDRELQLVHRDVSPQNVLLSYEGEVKVIDFGLAKSSLSTAKTNPSVVLGKFLYMSPEQARHQRVDRRSDLYAVGLCLYELLAGKNPLEDASASDLLAQVANPHLPVLRDVAPECPPALSDAVMRALSHDPSARFQTAEELRAKLLGVLLELDPGAGAESAAEFMRTLFANEYQQERKRVSAAREQLKPSPESMEAPGKRSTVTELPALKLEDVFPAKVLPPPLPPSARTARDAAARSGQPPGPARPVSPSPLLADVAPVERSPAAEANRSVAVSSLLPELAVADRAAIPRSTAAVEPTRPGIASPLLAEAARGGPVLEPTRPGIPSPLLAEAARGGPVLEPTRPGIPSPLLAELARGEVFAAPQANEPTRPGVPSPLLADTSPGVQSPLLSEPTSRQPVQDAGTPAPLRPLAGASAPTREMVIAIPEGARPTPAPQPAVRNALDDLLPDPKRDVLLARTHAPVVPPPVGLSAPTLPAMRAAGGVEPSEIDEPPLVMGTLLEDEEAPVAPASPVVPPPSVAPAPRPARSAAPERAAPPVPRTSTEPTLPRATPLRAAARTSSDDRVPTRELRAREPRRLGWLSPVVTVLVIALAGYFGRGFYQAGLFDGMLATLSPDLRARLHIHPIEGAMEKPALSEPEPVEAQAASVQTPPRPTVAAAAVVPAPASPAPVVAPPPTPKSASAQDDLALLQPLPAARPSARHRPAARKLSPLDREWRTASAEFHRLEAQAPCESSGMAMLCTRFRALQASLADGHEGADESKLLERVKELRRLIARKAEP